MGYTGAKGLCVVLACALPLAHAQQIISNFAGSPYRFDGDGQRAIQAPLGAVAGVAVDRQGQVYATDPSNHIVVRFTPNGTLTVIAGNGIRGYSGDGGPATLASLGEPHGIAVDASGVVYFSDPTYPSIRKITPDGVIQTIAGDGVGGFREGPGTMARFSQPLGIALDSAGNVYIADSGNLRIRKLSPDGTLTTVAGNGQRGFTGDGGPATSASLNSPDGVAVDAQGSIYVADTFVNRIRKISGGTITTVAGNNAGAFSGDGPGAQISLFAPRGVAVDSSGAVFIADTRNSRVRRLSTTGSVTTIAGSAASGFTGDGGNATAATLDQPTAVAIDSSGNIYIADTNNNRVRRVSSFGAISTAAGNGAFGASGDGGPALAASFRRPRRIAIDSNRNVYVADELACRIRKIDAGGTITTLAGNGEAGFSGDGGPAVRATLGHPSDVAVDRLGNVYISDNDNARIRRVTPDGVINTVAGGGDSRNDGVTALRLFMGRPQVIAVDNAGNLYFADDAQRLRKIAATTSIVTTVAGGGTSTADGVSATSAVLAGDPKGLTVDASGNLYFTERYRMRKVSASGTITTVAGANQRGCAGDGGPATEAMFSSIYGVAFDNAGNFYVSDMDCPTVRMVSPSGIITNFAGTGSVGDSGDGGPAANARLGQPTGLGVDPDGNVYITDFINARIRRVLTVTASVDVSPPSLSFSAAAGGTPPPAQSLNVATTFAGPAFDIGFDTTDGGAWLGTNALNGALPASLQVFADPTGLDPGAYKGTITIRTPGATPPARSVSVTFNVGLTQPPGAAVDPGNLSFSFTLGAAAISRQINVSNQGGGTLRFTVAARTNSGGDWLRVNPDSGSATPGFPSRITVSADPRALSPGTFTGEIIVAPAAGDLLRIPVTATLTSGEQVLLLSQTGLTFTAVAGGGTLPPQTFGILNTGRGQMSWTVRATALSGGSNWLSVSPNSGVTDAASLNVPLVEAAVRHDGLAPGEYYGQIEVSAPGATSSPQIVAIVLNVLPAGSDPGPLIRPTGLIFASPAGSNPGSQDVLISNLGASALRFISGRLSDRPGDLFTHQPVEGSIAPSQPIRITVQPTVSKADPQLYRGTLTFQFANGGAQTVSLLFVVVSPGGFSARSVRAAAGCAPSKLIPLTTLLSQGFSVSAGWPTPMEVRVVDDCGDPMVDGNVVATFSNGDPPLALASLKDGRWASTWLARESGQSQVTVTIKAGVAGTQLTGSAQVTGSVRVNSSPPVVSPGAVVNAANLLRQVPLSPGSLITITGARLADAPISATGFPLPNRLGSTQILVAGRLLPLIDVREDRVNAQLPYDLPVNARYQVVLQRGTAISAPPEEISVASTQPAIFTQDGSGSGQGLIYKLTDSGEQLLANASNPLSAGDRILVQCAGLGAVNPSVPAGAAAPSDPPAAAISQVSLTIGGVDVKAVFAGLAAGMSGVYQVRAIVPDGVPTGVAVPITITADTQTSAPVTAAFR